MFFQFTHELKHLQRVKPKVREQLAIERRLDRTPADALEDVDGVLLEPIRRLGNVRDFDQASKCSMNRRPLATA